MLRSSPDVKCGTVRVFRNGLKNSATAPAAQESSCGNAQSIVVTTFGERLSRAIADSPYDQKQVAERLGVSEGQVSRWANDKDYPGGRYLLQLPGLLAVDGHWLLTGDGQPRRREPSEDSARLRMIGRIATDEFSADALAGMIEVVEKAARRLEAEQERRRAQKQRAQKRGRKRAPGEE